MLLKGFGIGSKDAIDLIEAQFEIQARITAQIKTPQITLGSEIRLRAVKWDLALQIADLKYICYTI